MTDTESNDAIARSLGRIASGLYVLTAGTGKSATGMLASWVQQVGFEPPTVMVALKRGRPIEELVRQGGAFCLTVIDEASKNLMGHFARGFEPGAPAFEGIATATSAQGVPYPTGAAAHLECEVVGAVDDWGDHAVVCGKVVAGDGDVARQPMVHIRKNGLSY